MGAVVTREFVRKCFKLRTFERSGKGWKTQIINLSLNEVNWGYLSNLKYLVTWDRISYFYGTRYYHVQLYSHYCTWINAKEISLWCRTKAAYSQESTTRVKFRSGNTANETKLTFLYIGRILGLHFGRKFKARYSATVNNNGFTRLHMVQQKICCEHNLNLFLLRTEWYSELTWWISANKIPG